MLQNIRNNLQGTIAKIIIALIAIPFVLFGVDAFFTGGTPEVASVDGETITEPELARSIELQRRRLLAEMQDRIDPAMLEESFLREPVLNSLIERKLLEKTARDASFRIGEAMVNQVIIDDPNFQEDGVFSQARFQGILASNAMSPDFYKDMLREELLISQLMGGISGTEFVTEREMQDLARITQQSLDLRYLTVPVAAMAAEVSVGEAEVENYFEENREEFRTEEAVTVEYLELKLEDLFEPIPEQTLREEYAFRADDFKGSVERHAAHILIADQPDPEAKLSELRERIEAGEDFAALAKEFSEDAGSAGSGGDLGFSAGDAFPPEFEEALAALEPGQLSAPVQTDAGWHLIKLLELRATEGPSFEEVRSDIETELQRRAAEPVFVARSEQLADLTFNSEGLGEAAGALNLTPKRSAPFSRRGGEGVFADARVIKAAFSSEVLDDKQNSELLELAPEHVMVLHVVEHEPSRQQELAEIRERIVEVLKESLIRKRAAAVAEEVLASLRSGKSVEDAALERGYEWQTVPGHRRGADGVASELSRAAFSTPRAAAGSTWGRVEQPNGDVVVFEISNFREGSLADLGTEQQLALRRAIQSARGREVSEHYLNRLRESAEIERL
jgi:peptidyl-prolyl cis-trans isomerase D